ncbi:gliding motility-associated protein GldN [Candidatus Symbiothrix dinenymphae]|nr:gliding motility-associated protein GldN [Candidatus Symbiothrix dinenymphae]
MNTKRNIVLLLFFAVLLATVLPEVLPAQTTNKAQTTQTPRSRRQPAGGTTPAGGAAKEAAPVPANEGSVRPMTERARIRSQIDAETPQHIVWQTILYRMMDLKTEISNQALYYPSRPAGDRQNLFTLIFKLLMDGKIPAYNYSGDGPDVFSEKTKIDFEALLVKYNVLYTKKGTQFIVEDAEIPSPDVTSYMIKEGYFLNQVKGTFDCEVMAICPFYVTPDYDGGGPDQKEALFWVEYKDLRPYLARTPIMISDFNTALGHTLDDFFQKNLYKGSILKTLNMRDLPLAQLAGVTDPDALKAAQDSIENYLKTFNSKLWMMNDSVGIRAERAKLEKLREKPAKSRKDEPKPKGTTTTTTGGGGGEAADVGGGGAEASPAEGGGENTF